jgi:drug/metabolite transporter (DMT)-like permease
MQLTAGMDRSAAVQLGIVVAIFGAQFPLLKWGLSGGTSPMWFAAWRAVLCGVVSLAVVFFTGRLALPSRADWPPILGIGLCQIAIFFALLHTALKFIPAGTASVLSYTTSLWLVPIGAVFLDERITSRRLLAVALGLAGTAAIANPAAMDFAAPGQLLGVALLLAAALSWALAIATLRVARPRLATVQLLPFVFLVATLVLLPLALLLEPAGGMERTAPPWIALAYVGLLGPIATWAASEVSRALPPVVSSLGFLGVPVVGLLLSVALLGEPLTLGLALGAVLVVGGMALAVRG